MKSCFSPVLIALIALFLGLISPPARAQDDASFDFFYDTLSPYGEWIQVADYGLCWRPADVPPDWAPYTDGYWAYTDAGWTWVSYEDFGGIVYHYGRWVNLVDEGWAWVPGYNWGPAWVSWRSSDDYVGWAPLPPEVGFRPEVGVGIWVDTTYDIGPGFYRFCGIRDFGAPVISAVLLPPARNVVIIATTVNITNITVNNLGVPFCGGPRFEVISARVGRPIPTLKLVQETNIKNIVVNRSGHGPIIHAVQRGNALVLPAPALHPVANPLALSARYKPARVLTTKSVNKGWSIVATPADRERLRAKFKQDNRGATAESTPARALDPAELHPVPQKADLKAAPVAGNRIQKPGAKLSEANPAVPPARTLGAPVAGGFGGSGRIPTNIAPPKAPVAVAPEAPAAPAGQPTQIPDKRLKPFTEPVPGEKGVAAPGAVAADAKPRMLVPEEKAGPGEATPAARKRIPVHVIPPSVPAPGEPTTKKRHPDDLRKDPLK